MLSTSQFETQWYSLGLRAISERFQHVNAFEVAVDPIEPLPKFRVRIDGAHRCTENVEKRAQSAMPVDTIGEFFKT